MGMDREAGECLYEAQGGLVKTTHLYFPDLRKAFHMHMDASGHAIGATLLQQDDKGDLCLVTCVSKKLNPV